MSKAALKGFCACRIWPITTNSSTVYATGTKVDLPGAQELSKDISRSEFTIYADDGVYDMGSDFQYEELTLTLAELTPILESQLSGGTYDETDKIYTFKNTDTAPEFALAYAALKADMTYRQFMHYVAKVMSIKISHKTKGDGNDIQAYQVVLRCYQRTADGKIREIKDSTDTTHTWIDTVEQYPVV